MRCEVEWLRVTDQKSWSNGGYSKEMKISKIKKSKPNWRTRPMPKDFPLHRKEQTKSLQVRYKAHYEQIKRWRSECCTANS